MKISISILAMLLCPICLADSATIQGVAHRDVYVVEYSDSYDVFAKDGKEIANLSKKRKDFDVTIDAADPKRAEFIKAKSSAKPEPQKPAAKNKIEAHGNHEVAMQVKAQTAALKSQEYAAQAARDAEIRKQQEIQAEKDREAAAAAAEKMEQDQKEAYQVYLQERAIAAEESKARAINNTANATHHLANSVR